MNIESRIERLEKQAEYQDNSRHFIIVNANEDESALEAVSRYLKQIGLTEDQVGYAAVFSPNFYETVTFDPPVESLYELVGYKEWADFMKAGIMSGRFAGR